MDDPRHKNQRRLLIATGVILLVLMILIVILLLRGRSTSVSTAANPPPVPLVTATPVPAGEKIVSASYSIDCQVTVTTSINKYYAEKTDHCNSVLNYKISPDGQFLIYLGKHVYSLTNNAFTILDAPDSFTDYYFDIDDNLSYLSGQNLTYYFIPQLFQGYPDSFNAQTNLFNNLAQNKANVNLPDLGKTYQKISGTNDGLNILDPQGSIIFNITFTDLANQLVPNQNTGIDRTKLNWGKRIFYVDNNVYKTANLDGTDIIVHKIMCLDKEVKPNYTSHLFARSPDGTLLAFIYFSDQLNLPKPIDKGEIMLYDFVKDTCQATGLNQSVKYQESFAFSPDGSYLAYVDNGINIYRLDSGHDYQLATHQPNIYGVSSAVTGPLVWSGDSKFIYAAVSQLDANNAILSTALVQVYFNELYNGNETTILTVPDGTLYAVSPDGLKIVYAKNNNLYQYDIQLATNSFYKGIGQYGLTKLVWLRNNQIMTNILGSSDYQIDYNGEDYVYIQNGKMKIYDLTHNQDISPADSFTGQPLSLFY